MGFKGRIIEDWDKINFSDPEHVKRFAGAMNHFMREPDKSPEIRAALTHFTMKGDFPTEVVKILEKFHMVPSYDNGYEQIFDIRNFTDVPIGGFKIATIGSGLVFRQIAPGGKITLHKMTGAEVTVDFDRYGGGLGWLKTWFDDNTFWNMEDSAIEFRNEAYRLRAQCHYTLIEGLPNTAAYNVAWAAPEPAALATTNQNYVAVRDLMTINAACDEIIEALKTSGLGVDDSTPFILLAYGTHRSRIERALGLVQQPYAGSQKYSTYTVRPIYTRMLATKNVFYIIAPKKKIKGGTRQNLTLYNEFDIMSEIHTIAGWMRFGAGIACLDQLRRCAMA